MVIAAEQPSGEIAFSSESAVAILYDFLLRLTFGLALGMAITSPRRVASGFYRNHLYVTFGLAVLAALAAGAAGLAVWPAIVAAAASYLGSVCWLYEGRRAGIVCLWIVALAALIGVWLKVATLLGAAESVAWGANWLAWIAPVSSGLVLGLTMSAMLLGHWYLNAPGMEIAPLARLLQWLAVALALQMLVAGIGISGQLLVGSSLDLVALVLLALRWLFGLVGSLVLVYLAWETLKIPNTQSATGILYVALVAVFVGELSGLLLSVHSLYPL